MNTRQAILKPAWVSLFLLLSACSSPDPQNLPTLTTVPATSSPAATLTPSPVPATPTGTPLTCLTGPGRVEQDSLPDITPLQEFLIYLPPCYDELDPIRFPVIYLLHGQTYTHDQWVRLGAPAIADELIQSGQAAPFIVVFPDDHYWNAPAGGGFGERLIRDIIPYVDENYRTLAGREHRALGGLSRGGGWTVKLGFEHPELFGSLGLHSPAIFTDNAPFIEKFIQNIPEKSRPRLWFDIGDADKELGSGRLLEEVLTRNNYLHEYHLFAGDHSEAYWAAHVDEYLRWYAEAWQETQPP